MRVWNVVMCGCRYVPSGDVVADGIATERACDRLGIVIGTTYYD